MRIVMIRDTFLEMIALAIGIKTKSIERKVPRSTDRRVLERKLMKIRPITVRVAMKALRLITSRRSKR